MAADKVLLSKNKNIIVQVILMGRANTLLEYADETLKKDRKFILKVVKQDPITLQYVDEKVRENFIWDLIKDVMGNEK